MPHTTFVMAAHNAEATIAEAVESIEAQSVKDWELLVVDDASDDRTVETVTPYLRDPRIRILRNDTNRGAAFSRNRGIHAATSDLISVMDADDVSLPNRLADTLELFERFPRLVVGAGQLSEFGTWGGPVPANWPTRPEAIADRQRRLKVPVPHPSSTFRRQSVVDVGGYDEACLRSEDYALYLCLRDGQMACSEQIFVNYRTRRPVNLSYAITSGRYGVLARGAEPDLRR